MEASRQSHGTGFVLLGDQPYAADGDPLGFEAVAEDLASLILQSRSSTPFTLGIEAAWGMGKSSLMARLHRRLDDEKDVTPVMFNAWTADDGTVLEGLVKTVLGQLDPNILRRALRNRKLMGWLRVSGVVVASFLGVGSIVNAIWRRAESDPRVRNELRDLVEQAIANWRDSQPALGRRRVLCVFVDDLDRCSPQGVLEVFEAMKLYLDVPGVVFVVGYDQDIVSELVLREKGYSSEAIKSRDYLEKFIQIVYRIPRAVSDRSSALVESLLKSSQTETLFGATERQLVIDGSESNPRRIKRFINAFVLAYGLDLRWQEFQPQDLVRVQLLHLYFPEFARMLEHPSEDDPIEGYFIYRNARNALRRRTTNSPEVRSALAKYEMAMVEPKNEEEFDALLTRLEENVPVVFTSVAGREDFASLVESLSTSSDWSRLRVALAEGAFPVVSPDPVEGEAASSRGKRRFKFDGLRVLWVDDEINRNEPLAEALRAAGAQVALVPSAHHMEKLLQAERFDVLVTDIARPGDPNKGLKAIESLREKGREIPPVIFFTSRVSIDRMKRAEALDAVLVTQEDELLTRLEDAARRLRREHLASSLDDGHDYWDSPGFPEQWSDLSLPEDRSPP